ncbi:MAG: type VI secretion system baseplate subunit TssE [Phycisphaerae bacterium]|nr:type VI secretion system baseplate subunit TssE [Phycisphaerae bacterium]
MLLDRIAALGEERGRGRYEPTTEEDLEALMESVRRNLTRLLNARQGMAEGVTDYGLPALTDLTAGGERYVQRVQDAIRGTIEKYEPRLRRIRVTHQVHEGDVQTLVFRVDAVMVGRSGEHRVWYETAFAPTGKFAVMG